MKLRILCLAFIWSLSVNAQSIQAPTVTLPAPAAEFFLQKYYAGVRDSLLLQNAEREKQYLLGAIDVRSRQLESCQTSLAKKDTIALHLVQEKKLAVDSVQVKCEEKTKRLKKRIGVRNWIIVVLGAYALAKTL